MRLWVTGARGFIGRHVVAQAQAAGHDVWALTRTGALDGTHLTEEGPQREDGEGRPAVRSLAIDIADGVQVAALVRQTAPEAIIHLAWYARPHNYLVAEDNVDSLATTLSFGRAALNAGCSRMVGVGTCVEYADSQRARRESDQIDPKSLYARCKHAGHLVLEELFSRMQGSLTWARLFHMHGPGEHRARLIPAVVYALREGREFALSPGEQQRDHLDVRDVASALLHLAAVGFEGTVNVCSGVPITLRSLLEIIGNELGRSDLLAFGARPYQPGEVMNLTGDAGRLFGTGWRPAHADLNASLRESIAAVMAAETT